jgi:uncharacterized protein YcnI
VVLPACLLALSPLPNDFDRRHTTMRLRYPAATTAAAPGLALPAAAQAHVTVNPSTAPAGSFAELLVRVPNEQDNANTTKVDLQLPPGFVEASYEAQPGWTVKVTKRKLATPVQTDDGPVTEEVARITWTATGKQGAIAPGQFKDFPLSVQIPDSANTALTFKALQTYSNGQIVRWIGAPDSDTPAPQVKVTPASVTAAPAPAAKASDANGASKGLGIAALVAGILGLLLGGAALLTARRRPGVAADRHVSARIGIDLLSLEGRRPPARRPPPPCQERRCGETFPAWVSADRFRWTKESPCARNLAWMRLSGSALGGWDSSWRSRCSARRPQRTRTSDRASWPPTIERPPTASRRS